jgi:hypothetical protein
LKSSKVWCRRRISKSENGIRILGGGKRNAKIANEIRNLVGEGRIWESENGIRMRFGREGTVYSCTLDG